jgi:hypothetical protein
MRGIDITEAMRRCINPALSPALFTVACNATGSRAGGGEEGWGEPFRARVVLAAGRRN